MKRRQNVLIVLFVIAIMAVYTGYEANKPQPIDWSPNFSISKKSPYGTYIIKDALPYLFPEGEVSFARMSVREQLRCLLYTSPSPRDRTRSRMPSSA